MVGFSISVSPNGLANFKVKLALAISDLPAKAHISNSMETMGAQFVYIWFQEKEFIFLLVKLIQIENS